MERPLFMKKGAFMKMSQLVVLVLVLVASNAMASTVLLQEPTATFSQALVFVQVNTSIDGITSGLNGWAISPSTSAETAAYETQSDVVGGTGGSLFTFSMIFGYMTPYDLGKFRISVTTADRSDFADGNTGAVTPGDVGDPSIWTQLTPLSATATNGVALAIQGDNSVLVTSTSALTTYTITADTPIALIGSGITGIRLEALNDPSLPNGGPGMDGASNFVLSEFEVSATDINPEPASAALLIPGILMLIKRRGGAGRAT